MSSDPDQPQHPKKKKKGRSPNFPAIDLSAAIDRAQSLYDKENRHEAAASTVLSHWGYSQKSSGGGQALAALKSFGLTVDDGVGDARKIRLSDLALKILLDKREGSRERAEAIKEAALTPKIHADLWGQFGGQLPSDENLRYKLLVERQFTESGASDFIQEFKSTLSFAKLPDSGSVSGSEREESTGGGEIVSGSWVQWNSQGADQFKVPCKVTSVTDDGFAFVEGTSTGIPLGELTISQPPADPKATPPPVPLIRHERKPGMKQATYPFDSGVATFEWPAEMNAAEYEDFKDWLRIIARKVGRAVAATDTDLGLDDQN